MSAREALFEHTGRDDIILPFQIDPYGLRGRLIRLGPVVDRILGRHDYPEAVAAMLGETMALAACLAGALKYDGIFTLQTKGDGPIGTLMADITSDGEMRAYARYDADRLAAVEPAAIAERSVPRLLGGGYIAFTVDQGANTDRYQGIVELEGRTLSECTHSYFRNSEQLEAGVLLAAGQAATADGPAWRAGALMIQRLPYQRDLPGRPSEDEYDENWRTAVTLMSSGTVAELLSAELPPDRLLFRLFHSEGVRAFQAQPVVDACRCSNSRVDRVLRALSVAELEELKQGEDVVVVCEFCKREWRYDDAALAALRDGEAAPSF
ncbi:33 kDa chaperonin [Thalassobaculum fulvum]|uniref:33 kDa chaperonin n=1 Tax=Thalassobaculum fulvum TaxID=1633335 RepID=A0A919CRE6_9PROT|nr:Hsp33 family molecular chaperone HslO [Thalassobaculum fulvum]GHD59212.1 33 kDa chaperonin [Thalassobaculum fulvum]